MCEHSRLPPKNTPEDESTVRHCSLTFNEAFPFEMRRGLSVGQFLHQEFTHHPHNSLQRQLATPDVFQRLHKLI